jgi:ubiquinone biosynthesis monooxygenase Coq7
MRQYSWFDHTIQRFDKIINPIKTDDAYAASLMRVNHSGEVCAQALYKGQAFVARDQELVKQLNQAALEEQEHLLWCKNRIHELKGRTSFLNPLWSIGSFGIGIVAGLAGDKLSLGFLAETEYQVVHHLDSHIEKLPFADVKSRKILLKMKEDELRHATSAMTSGGVTLPFVIRTLMKIASKIMTMTSRFI